MITRIAVAHVQYTMQVLQPFEEGAREGWLAGRCLRAGVVERGTDRWRREGSSGEEKESMPQLECWPKIPEMSKTREQGIVEWQPGLGRGQAKSKSLRAMGNKTEPGLGIESENKRQGPALHLFQISSSHFRPCTHLSTFLMFLRRKWTHTVLFL